MRNQKDRYDISVIIPTYNRSQLLSFTLTSLAAQNIDHSRYEVIVADDGSTDDTRDMLRAFENRINLKYVYQEDLGYRPASARNKGILSAEGKICLFIDSSVIVNNNCLEKHILFHENYGSNVSAIGYVYGFDRTKESEEMLKSLVDIHDAAGSIRRLSTDPIFSDVRDIHYANHADQIHLLPAPWYFFWTCHLSVQRENLLNVGLFDESYDGRWGVEDNDLGFRLFKSGVNIHLLREAESIHYPHNKDKEERKKEGYLNCIYFHNKFQALETKLFMDYYGDPDFMDINLLYMRMQLEGQPITEG